MGGRPVHWTCLGTPGASTKRITGDIEQWFQVASNKDDYDVVVVLAGLNDLKGIMLPFLTTDDGRNDATFKEGLRNIFFLLRSKLRWKVEKLREKRNRTGNDDIDGHLEEAEDTSTDISSIQPPESRPLVVIPALPTLPIPLFQYPPLCWFIHSLFQCLDDDKRALSNEHPDAILFVDAPSPKLIESIEEGTSEHCTTRKTERVILALNDVKDRTKRKIESLMKEHSLSYSQPDKVCEIEESCDEAFHTNLIKKMPAFLGSKLVSLDKIHPNDQGYDYWGRHIASAIVKEWKHSR